MKSILKKIPWIIFLSLYLYSCNQYCSSEKDAEISYAESVFDELNDALKRDNGELWNHSLKGPLMLVDPEDRSIYANEGDKENNLKKTGSIYTGKLPENINIANTAFNWNGKRWTMVGLPLPENEHDRLNLLIHESFHRIQPLIGFDSLSEKPCNHLNSMKGRIYLKLELKALQHALSTNDSEEHIINALLFRKYRQQIFPEAESAENSLEMLEGFPEYTSSILSGWNDKALREHYENSINDFFKNPSFNRSFPYYTFPVYGYFMKISSPDWNKEISNQTNLTEYVLDFFNVNTSSVELKEKIDEISIWYDSKAILAYEKSREEKRLQEIENYKRIFLGDSVFSIDLKNMNIRFDPRNIIPLDSFGNIYPEIRVTDNWGILNVDSGSALLSTNWNKITVTYPTSISDSIIHGNGWYLKLNPGWEIEKKGYKYLLRQ